METPWIAETAGGRPQPIDLAEQQRTAIQVAGGEQERSAVTDPAAEHAVQIDVALRTVAGAAPVLHLQFHPVETTPGDEVRHPGHRVRAVDRGRAVLEHFHPLHRQQRHQRRQIHEARAIVGGHRGEHLPLAVQQHEGGGHAQPAQVDVGRAGGEVLGEVVRVVLGTVVERKRIHQVAQVFGGPDAQFVCADLGERRRRGRLPLDAAAGARHHHDFLNVGHLVADALVRTEGWRGGRGQCRADQPARERPCPR